MGMTSHSGGNKPRLSFRTKGAIIIALAMAVAAVVYLKAQRESPAPTETSQANSPADGEHKANPPRISFPQLVDLGADKCIPCKMMAPILEELRGEYKDRFKVVFIDVWKNPQVGREYKVRVIPTQIFFDASEKELYRHEGFYSKEDILNKWRELGFDFEKELGFEKKQGAVKELADMRACCQPQLPITGWGDRRYI